MDTNTNQAAPAAVTCGNGCACMTQCGDTYAAHGLPRPPARRPTLTIRALVEGGPQALHESEGANLVDYVHDLERRHQVLEGRTREGTAGLRPQVLSFAWLMEHRLRKHDEERGARGWIHDHPADLAGRISDCELELARALVDRGRAHGEEQERATRRAIVAAADAANFAMMTADTVGGLDGVGPGPVPKMRKRLRQIHRLHAHVARLVERQRAQTNPPAAEHKILALLADAKALDWVLRVLDPQAQHAPRPAPIGQAIEGDGSGQALPPVDPSNPCPHEAPAAILVAPLSGAVVELTP